MNGEENKDEKILNLDTGSPVKAKSVKECRQSLHHQEDGHRENSKQTKHWN